jgi:hypothetical protein
LESIFLPLADFLTDLGNSLRNAVEADDGFQQLTIALAAFTGLGVLLAGVRQIIRWLLRTDSRDREDKRKAERETARIGEILGQTEDRVDELLKYDPETFLKDVAKAREDGVLAKRQSLPEEWLEPLRPALARAYADLAEEKLLFSSDKVGLAEAHRLAYAAYAADPDMQEVDDLFEAINGAKSLLAADNMSQQEREIWQQVSSMRDPIAMYHLAETLERKGRYATGVLVAQRSADLLRQQRGAADSAALAAKFQLGQLQGQRGRYTAALQILTEVWEARVAAPDLGPDHPQTLVTRSMMAWQLNRLGQHKNALEISKGNWETYLALPDFGPDHAATLSERAQMAENMGYLGQNAEALAIFTEVWEAQVVLPELGRDHSETRVTRSEMGRQMGLLGQHEGAMAIYKELWEACVASPDYGINHPETLVLRLEFGFQLAKLGQFADALVIATEVWEAWVASPDLGPTHLHTLIARLNMGDDHSQLGAHDLALDIFTEAWEACCASADIGPDHPTAMQARLYLARELVLSDKDAETGIKMFRDVLAQAEAADHTICKGVWSLRWRYIEAQMLDHMGRDAEAGDLLEGLLDEMNAQLAPTHFLIREVNALLKKRGALPD